MCKSMNHLPMKLVPIVLYDFSINIRKTPVSYNLKNQINYIYTILVQIKHEKEHLILAPETACVEWWLGFRHIINNIQYETFLWDHASIHILLHWSAFQFNSCLSKVWLRFRIRCITKVVFFHALAHTSLSCAILTSFWMQFSKWFAQ